MQPKLKPGPSPPRLARVSPRALALGALTALLVATPLIPSESVAELGAGLLLVVLWLLLLAGWALAAVIRGEVVLRAGPAVVAAAALAGCVAVSGWINAWEGNPRATINSVWQWVALAAAFFLLRQWLVRPEERRAVCSVMIGLAAALAVFGYWQYFVSLPQLRLQFLQDPAQAYLDAGAGPNPDPQVQALITSRVLSTEPLATFALANSLAAFLATWLVLAVGVGWLHGRQAEGRWRLLAGVGVASVLIGGCLVLTKSRTAWLATAFGLAALAMSGWRGAGRIEGKVLATVVALSAGLFLASVWVGGLDAQVWSEAPKSVLYRLEYWQATAAMIRDHPWWGVGVGNFQNYYPAYKLPQASETVADPHNLLLEVWATAGAPALLALAALLAAVVWQVRRAGEKTEASPPEEKTPKGPGTDPFSARSGPFPVYAGAAAGLVLAFPLGLAAGFPVDVAFYFTGVPAGATCVVLLHRWAGDGRLPARLPLIAATVLLVNFLAAGGIGFASVATSLWLLAALALGEAENFLPPRRLGKTCAAALAAGAVGLVVTCYFTAYRPTLSANAALSRATAALEANQPRLALQELHAAARADRYSPRPWQDLAALLGQQWVQSGSERIREAFEQAWREAVRRDRRSYGLWKFIGDTYFEGYERQGDQGALEASLAAYRQAVELHPTHAGIRVGLAWRLYLAGDRTAAAEQATAALALDERNPHREQKLAEFPPLRGSEARNLEHLAEKLRKLEGSGASSL